MVGQRLRLIVGLLGLSFSLGCTNPKESGSELESETHDVGDARSDVIEQTVDIGLSDGGSSETSRPDTSLPHAADVEAGEADILNMPDISDGADDTEQPPTEFAAPWNGAVPLGGQRPAALFLPDDYTTTKQWPLVIMLHGYGSTAAFHNTYFGLEAHATTHGYIGVAPEGIRDMASNQFWTATNACCDHYGGGVDDATYLTNLLDEAESRLAIDRRRIYFLGHSNGAFMSYRMACELGSRVAALVSLAGSVSQNPDDCASPGSTAVLEIHGTLDNIVPYNGGNFFGKLFPGVEETPNRWIAINQCQGNPTTLPNIDVALEVTGAETEVRRWSACADGTSVELWRVRDAGHIPTLSSNFMPDVIEFLYRHQRQP